MSTESFTKEFYLTEKQAEQLVELHEQSELKEYPKSDERIARMVADVDERAL